LRFLTYFLLGAGGLIALAALAVVFFSETEPESIAPQPSAEATQTAEAAVSNGSDISSDASAKTDDKPDAASDETSVTQSSDLVIDLAQVKPDGQAVFAGKGKAGAKITVFEGDVLLGDTIADANGEWVIILEKTLGPGQHLVSVMMETKDGEQTLSEVTLAIEIAESKSEKPLVAVLPQTDAQTPKLLQSPDDKPVASAEATDAGNDAAEKVADLATSDSRLASSQEVVAVVPALAPRALVWRDNNQLAVSGVSKGGVRVGATLDGGAFSEALVLSNGDWILAGEIDMTRRQVELGFTLYDETGVAIASYQLPVKVRDLEKGLDGSQMVVINKGDALWRIAYRRFGEGVRYVDIVRRNASVIDDPDLIYPNQIFALPKE
jgi:nucleoid-associated protein YgaU